MITTIYDKNLNALREVNPLLFARLHSISGNKQFEVFQGKDPLQINFYDNERNIAVFDKPLEDVLDKIESYKSYDRYAFFYFFGLGNGVFIKTILGNPLRKRVAIIEPNLEIIYIVLNLLDFSQEFLDKRLVIHYYSDLDFSLSASLFVDFEAKIFSKLFFLDMMSPYYNAFHTELISTSALLTDALNHAIVGHGNDTLDSLIGIEHHIANLPIMLKNPPLTDLLKKPNSDTAIIVSTGPSLAKQLPLLKEIAPYVTLISIDASLPILEKWGIKPDIVVSIERVEATSKFYKNTSEEFQKDIIYVIASLAHREVITSIKNGTTILAMRPFTYTKFFNLDAFGYIGVGMSAANMAHDMVALMKFKQCILIGQDLAFGEDGSSHSQGHIFGECEVNNQTQDLFVEKYGGGGTIKTTIVWKMFLGYYEKNIASTSHFMDTINATEGGARIQGSIEKPFKELCEEIKTTHLSPKQPINVLSLSEQEYRQNMEQVKEQIDSILAYASKTQKKIEKIFVQTAEMFDQLKVLNEKNELDRIDYTELVRLNAKIDAIKDLFNNPIFGAIFFDVIQSYILHQEMDLALLSVAHSETDEEKKVKLVDWIMQHRYWLFSLAGGIDATREAIKRGKKMWGKEPHKS